MKKLKLLVAVCALILGGGITASAETDYTSLMPNAWTNSNGDFQGGRELYQTSNYSAGKIMYQSFTAPVAGIYEIKFYAVTSSTSGRGFNNIFGENIAQAYASAGENKSTLPMTVIDQTGCTLVADANIRTLSVEAAEGETIEYGLENIATGGNWYTIKALSAKMKTVAEIFQAQYDEAYAIWENSTENVDGARATFKTYVDALQTAMSGTLAEAQTASDNLAEALVTYENNSYPIKGKGVKYDFTSKMNMAINAWTCKQGNGPAQYGFTGATETYGNTTEGEVMYQTLTGLANGEYEIHFYAVSNAANGGGTAGTGLTYVYANDQKLDIEVITQSSCTPSDYERTFTVMVKDGTIKYGITNTAAAGNWNICKNVALYMTGAPDLSDYYDAIAEKITTANGLKSSKMNADVLAALESAVNATEGYENITVIGTLETLSGNLTTAINNAKTSIDTYAEALTILDAASTLDATGQASYKANETVAALQSAYNEATLVEVTSEQKAAAETALVAAAKVQTTNGADMTLAIINPSFEKGNLTGWTASKTNGDTGVKANNGVYAVDNADGNYLFNTWDGDATGYDITQTLTDMPAGKYLLKASFAGYIGGKVNLIGNDEQTTFTNTATGTSTEVSLEFNALNGTITLGAGNADHWYKVDNFHLTYVQPVEFASANDYTALNEVITTAETKTLGFEETEYAPYKNVEALEALAAAKAIDQTVNNAKIDVTAATAALTAATWTANTEDVECVYNGDFSIGTWGMTGWSRPDSWGKNLPGDEASITTDILKAAGANNGTAYYNQPGSLQYGNEGIYTMPLKANTIYTLTFKYASWAADSNDGMKVSVLNGDEGMAVIAYEANKTKFDVNNAFVTKTVKFVTGAAGNYVLKLANSGNTVITDVSITKDASQVLEFADNVVPSYAPGTYPAVKITRSLTARRWATAVYPFVVSGVDKLAKLDACNNDELHFTSVTANEANKPFVMRNETDLKEVNLSDVAVEAAVATDVTVEGAAMKGVYAETTVAAADGVTNYVFSNNVIYPVGANSATVTPYRAYIQVTKATVEGGTRSLKFVVDGEVTTGIDGIAADVENGSIYNLQGQQVKAAQKGIFIQNGRKVVVK